MKQKLRILVVGMLLCAGLLLSGGPVFAADAKSADKPDKKDSVSKTETEDASPSLIRTYNANPNVQTGMVVQVDPKNKNTVIPLSQKNIKELLGVIIPNGDVPLVLTPEKTTEQQVLVAPSGNLLTVIVSNQNGPVKKGDYIAISAIDGIGMVADDSIALTIGRAESSFDGKTDVVNTMTVKNSLKQDVRIAIGRVQVQVGVTHNPSLKQSNSDYVPAFIGKIVFQVTSKNVSAARVYIAIVLLIGIIILAGHMLYGGIRGGMIAIGRNPLSKKSIIVSLVQTVFFATVIFVGGVAGVFFLLKL
jgi:hypothetical protein